MSNTTKINFKQKQILADFMLDHNDLAKGVLQNTSQGKATANRLWENLTIKLNASGPSLKNAKTWRKVYADQKQLVKRKLSFNKSSKRKPGGGPYEEKHLSIAEEQILEVQTFGSQIQEGKETTSPESPTQTEYDEYKQIIGNEENEDSPSKICSNETSNQKGEPMETKTFLLKKNITATDKYHAGVLKRMDKIIELKETKITNECSISPN